MTDDDPAIERAVRESFQIRNHGLCGWHIIKNLGKKIFPLLSAKKKKTIIGDFLDVARSGNANVFPNTWRSFRENYTEKEKNTKFGEKPITYYLDLLFEKREKWEASFFASKNVATLSIEST